MKRILIFITILLGAFTLSSQAAVVDPSVSGIALVSADTATVGGAIVLEFTATNAGSSPTSTIATGGFQVVVSTPLDLSNNPLYMQYASFSVISTYGGPTGGSYFTWTWDAVEGVFVGVNNQPMGFLASETVQVTYSAISPTIDVTATHSVIAGIEVHALLGTPNLIANDLGSTPVWIAAPAPMGTDQLEFDVNVDNCDVLASWSNGNEDQLDRYELQYSEKYNYMEYRSLTEMQAKGDDEKYFFKTDLNTGAYNFRLATYTKDGRVAYAPIVHRDINCDGVAKVRVKSNPIVGGTLELINTAINDRVEIHDLSGKLVKSFDGTDLITRISDIGVSDGMYLVTVLRDGQLIYSESVKL